MRKNKALVTALIITGLALCVSIGIHIYGMFFRPSYLRTHEQIYVMEAGILYENLRFREGPSCELQYDFTHDSYSVLREKYQLERTAGQGTALEKAMRLMDEYAPRLKHQSDYDNSLMNALDLLAYSLDNRDHGIHCRAKAQILNEMCLALGIPARKVWINPYSCYDNDCHVVNEIWDSTRDKWVMLDITQNTYWIDEEETPLSVLEIRDRLAARAFCTPVEIGEKKEDLQALKKRHMENFLYIAKNMVFMQYCTIYTVGESESLYVLLPENMQTKYEWIVENTDMTCIARGAVERGPAI